MSEKVPLVLMENIDKSYPGVQALADVSFTLHPGEIHSICGENGAGKSTLIKILTGAERKNSGTILLEGQQIEPKTPLEAQQLGISTVYQEVNLCPNLSVAENIFIGRQPRTKVGSVNWTEMNRLAMHAMARLNIRLNVADTLDEYSVAIQQMVAIARAVDVNAKVLVLDEPTSSLDPQEVERLFTVVRRLKESGMGIIFISHFLDQIYEISDRITVLRNGRLVDSQPVENLNRLQLVSKMIGKDYEQMTVERAVADVQPEEDGREYYYFAKNLGKRGTIAEADVGVFNGEVLGLAGLLGCGRTETARLMFGIDRPDHAEVTIRGKQTRIHSPSDAIKASMAFCPEDRKADGVIGNLSVRENIILALQGRNGMFRRINSRQQKQIAEHFIKLLSIATPGPEQLVRNLSGGNQQKVILARWLATEPDLLILDEPTRGIDVGAKEEIMNLVVKLAQDDKAVVFISSELDEVVRVCSRALVYRDRKQIAELKKADLSPASVMSKIAFDAQEEAEEIIDAVQEQEEGR